MPSLLHQFIRVIVVRAMKVGSARVDECIDNHNIEQRNMCRLVKKLNKHGLLFHKATMRACPRQVGLTASQKKHNDAIVKVKADITKSRRRIKYWH